MSPNLLDVDHVIKRFGGFKALNDVSFTLAEGEILGIVGPNGSGKTTLINVISGLYAPDGGSVRFRGYDVRHLGLTGRSRRGINRTFQIPKPFRQLTVAQNVALARHYGRHASMPIEDPLAFLGLAEMADWEAGRLTSAQQKLLDLARALATGPRLLLVDELAAGLNPQEMHQVSEKLLEVARQGVGIIVVEHLLGFVNHLTRRVLVMNAGQLIFEGSLAEAAHDPTVVAVYLGG
ncbi:ABC transporter related protein [Sulfobacillus acidophilus TPY]|uniref:Amino acid/amide ABC transporter ATP-binding protein 1, HAAT family n=1 Tax=Sulfobacillus acidophilus (strain ATCC 700253 / DSM 10332 / NAL) TaxID=679936 RepID=G8TSG6_SULAD|nr:ABC transporter related protein [Sulfobacillus acidophilus TPY]AEW06658.1 amino acid/amide ABC transporter ATP-binding protein 1, HAAT family [Sulfobacillus acidophilus DSM 10332]